MAMDKKDVKCNFRVSKKELKYLEKLAIQNQMTVSDYIRARIFELPVAGVDGVPSPFSPNFERELMRLAVNSYLLIKRTAQNTIGDETIQECRALAADTLKNWGYE